MLVGLNYPFAWNAYGLYFGGGNPPGSFAALDGWIEHLRENLVVLRDELGLGVVRIFLLCNAFNYGTVTDGVFAPPAALHPKFFEHLEKMLRAFQDTGLRVIPSLVDFKAFGRSRDTNGCTDRRAILTDGATRRVFFEQTLEAFLTTSHPFKASIYAWEVQNEPVWNTNRVLNSARISGGRTASVAQMSAFLEEGVERIHAHGFDSSVGHRFASDMDRFPTGNRRQFHYYPVPSRLGALLGLDRTLPHFDAVRAFLGELGVTAPEAGHGAPWPELDGADAGDSRSRVVERLRLVRAKGYRLALLWPDGADGRGSLPPAPGPDPLHLSQEAQRGVIDFTKTL